MLTIFFSCLDIEYRKVNSKFARRRNQGVPAASLSRSSSESNFSQDEGSHHDIYSEQTQQLPPRVSTPPRPQRKFRAENPSEHQNQSQSQFKNQFQDTFHDQFQNEQQQQQQQQYQRPNLQQVRDARSQSYSEVSMNTPPIGDIIGDMEPRVLRRPRKSASMLSLSGLKETASSNMKWRRGGRRKAKIEGKYDGTEDPYNSDAFDDPNGSHSNIKSRGRDYDRDYDTDSVEAFPSTAPKSVPPYQVTSLKNTLSSINLVNTAGNTGAIANRSASDLETQKYHAWSEHQQQQKRRRAKTLGSFEPAPLPPPLPLGSLSNSRFMPQSFTGGSGGTGHKFDTTGNASTNTTGGYMGPNGSSGFNGPSGVNGPNGFNGPNGPNGLNGLNVPNGFNGSNGTLGVSGGPFSSPVSSSPNRLSLSRRQSTPVLRDSFSHSSSSLAIGRDSFSHSVSSLNAPRYPQHSNLSSSSLNPQQQLQQQQLQQANQNQNPFSIYDNLPHTPSTTHTFDEAYTDNHPDARQRSKLQSFISKKFSLLAGN